MWNHLWKTWVKNYMKNMRQSVRKHARGKVSERQSHNVWKMCFALGLWSDLACSKSSELLDEMHSSIDFFAYFIRYFFRYFIRYVFRYFVGCFFLYFSRYVFPYVVLHFPATMFLQVLLAGPWQASQAEADIAGRTGKVSPPGSRQTDCRVGSNYA